ncbi:MAG: DUF3883 domain-containing protein [Pelosinus sp.]|nr:DUF3883 domain-containing protein [Pelosinus sp.]
MEVNHKLALIIAYYLSRFDRDALSTLGYASFTMAFGKIGEKMGMNPNTIKNMRDEYDPLHSNKRKGWHQRELRPSRLEVVEKYQYLSENALAEIVRDILSNQLENPDKSDNIQIYIDSLNLEDKRRESTKSQKEYGTRGITGKQAEDIFLSQYEAGAIKGLRGHIIDKRNDGCGYDFELESDQIVFEVKGISAQKGGIIFTDKEWSVAKKLKDRYVLVLISNINIEPIVTIIVNPYKKLQATKRIYQTIAINWAVESRQLFTI